MIQRFLLLVSVLHVQANLDSTLLSQWAFIMSHDAGTGYLNLSENSLVAAQTVGLLGQLNCGSRAFDLRPAISFTGSVMMVHGPVLIPVPLSSALQEVVDWAAYHEGELILLYINNCFSFLSLEGISCLDPSISATLIASGIPLISNCTLLQDLTVSRALEIGALSGGGRVLAIAGCVQENFVQSQNIGCYSATGQPCYGGDANGTAAFLQLEAYLNTTTTAFASPSAQPGLWMAQAHWQYDQAQLIATGNAHSSLILDTERGDVNPRVAALVPTFKALNLLELNDVCYADQVGHKSMIFFISLHDSETLIPTCKSPFPFRAHRAAAARTLRRRCSTPSAPATVSPPSS